MKVSNWNGKSMKGMEEAMAQPGLDGLGSALWKMLLCNHQL